MTTRILATVALERVRHYDRAVDGPLIDFGDNSSWVDPEQPTLLDGGES